MVDKNEGDLVKSDAERETEGVITQAHIDSRVAELMARYPNYRISKQTDVSEEYNRKGITRTTETCRTDEVTVTKTVDTEGVNVLSRMASVTKSEFIGDGHYIGIGVGYVSRDTGLSTKAEIWVNAGDKISRPAKNTPVSIQTSIAERVGVSHR